MKGNAQRIEAQLLDLMQKHELDPHNTVGIFVPTGEDEESITELAAAMCGEQPEQVLVIEKAEDLQGFARLFALFSRLRWLW